MLINTTMRNWINLFEMKMVEGYKSSLSPKELQQMVEETDYRGVAYKNQVFMYPAYEIDHHGMRYNLGIPQLYGRHGDDTDQHGFDFYAYSINNGDPHNEREEWALDDRKPAFQVGSICIETTEEDHLCLKNKEFARMVSQTVMSENTIVETQASQLSELTWRVRNAYLDELDLQIGDATLGGCCTAAAHDLKKLLADNGIDSEVIDGMYARPSEWDGERHEQTPHSWVECQGFVLDPTREQFESDELISQNDPDYHPDH